MKVASNLLGLVVFSMTVSCDHVHEQPRSRAATATVEHPTPPAVSDDLTAPQIEQLIDTFRSAPSSHVARPGGPPTGGTPASNKLLLNIDRSAPALLASLAATDNDIRRHAAYTLGASKRQEFAAPLERAIATELSSHIHQPYVLSGIPDDYYFAALRAMVLAAARTGGVQSLRNVITSAPKDPLAVRAVDDSLKRVVDRAPCNRAENTQVSCLDKWRQLLADMDVSRPIWAEDER